MFSESEAQEGYIQILEILSRSNLSWVVPQIQEEISRGKIIVKSLKDISVLKAEWKEHAGTYGRTTSKEKMSISEPYSEREQLNVLLSALEELSEIQVIKGQILQSLRSIDQSITSIEFIPEDENVPRDSISSESLQEGREVFQNLNNSVTQIKSEI